MSELAQPTSRVSTPVPIATRLTTPLTLCLVTTAVVASDLISAPQGAHRIPLPILVAGAAVLFGVGFNDLVRGRGLHFARAVIAGGVVWSLSALAGSPASTAYSVGRVSQWLVELTIIYLLLSYPSGRLTTRVSRRLFVAGSLLVALLYLPAALIAQYPNPSPWSMCTSGCPPNAFALSSSTPAVVPNIVVPLRELLTVALLVAVAAVVIQQARNSGALLRRMGTPMALIAVAQVVTLAVYFRARAVDPTAGSMHVLSWIDVLSLPAVAMAAVAGRLYRRLFAARALDRIARKLRMSADQADVRRAMADALEDPSLQILRSFPDDGETWFDESGDRIAVPEDGPERAVTEIAERNWRIAIVHDPALSEDPDVVNTAGSYALAALENHRLTDRLYSSLEELAEARAFSVDAERRERRKIERDIHDGAQQRLVSLRIKLALATEQIGSHDAAGGDALRALGDDVDATIDEVRSFAHGVYPVELADTGLRGALLMLARATALPTKVDVERLARYPRPVETTIYFSCSEAVQNAVKHAHGATCITVRVWHGEELNFEVRDDGAGFDPQTQQFGTGLRNLRDRLAAVGGTLRIRSAPGDGTTVAGTIPISAGELPRHYAVR
jgi:signal transduction histidine kinase